MDNINDKINLLKLKYQDAFKRVSTELKEKLAQNTLEELIESAYIKWHAIVEYRKSFECKNCGACCKLACSEFSPEELLEKSKNGDVFATQFLSIFVPYETEEQAREIYPQYYDTLKANGEKAYFYHCPKVTKDNKCPVYEKRPQICRDFPDNPIGFLPMSCGFEKWKNQVEDTALELKALFEIVDYLKKNS